MKRNNPLWSINNYLFHHVRLFRDFLQYRDNKKFVNWIKYADKQKMWVNITQEYINKMLEKYDN